MNRKEVINYIKSEVFPLFDLSQEIDMNAAIKVISKFRVENNIKVNEPMKAEVNEYGHLFINGIHAGQITNKIPRANFSEYSYIIENKILSRSEEY